MRNAEHRSQVMVDAGIAPHVPGMTGATFKVYFMLVYRRNRRTGQLNPSIATICRDAGLNRDTVCKAIAELVDAGLLRRRRSRGANHYELAEPPLLVRKTRPSKTGNLSEKPRYLLVRKTRPQNQ